MARKISSRLEDLDLSQDELNRLGEALKKEEFRELLVEYAREINDPANKKIYEDEITQLENERGVDIKFVHPEPLYVLKTCYNPGGEKVFVNICSNPLVGKPTNKPSQDSKGVSGINWSIPLIQAPAREDMDKSGLLCTVYDVLFHPETHTLATKDKRFRNFVDDTALNAIEETFSVKLDRDSVKRPRMKFKGTPQPTVIRSRRPEGSADKRDDDELISQFPYPYSLPPKEGQNVRELKQKPPTSKMETSLKQNYITPKYVLKQSSDVDMSNYEQNHLSHHDVTIPQRIVILVDLPYVKSSSELELDVEAQKASLVSNGKKRYRLDVKLPYPVQESQGSAKFDQDAGKLIVTLLVDREKCVMKKYHVAEGDSGIDSDACCSRVGSSEEEESKLVAELAASIQSVDMWEDKEGNSINGDKISPPEEYLTEVNSNVYGAAEVDKVVVKMFEVGTTEGGTIKGINENVNVKEMENISKTINHEEVEIIPPKSALVQESNESSLITSEKNYDSAVPEKSVRKHSEITKELLQPGVPYILPSFSCNCLKEMGNTTVTYILHVKNVDPVSMNKKVLSLDRVPTVKGDSECQNNVLLNGALPSENGSVCNEYRTMVEQDSPVPIHSNVNSASENEGNGMEETSGLSNCPTSTSLNRMSSGVSLSEDVSTKSVSYDPSKSTSECDTSQLKGNLMSKNELGVPGAYITLPNQIMEKNLSVELRDNLVIKEDAPAATKTQEECGPILCGEDITCFQVAFSSIGAGFFPQSYAFCIALPTSQWPNFDPESVDTLPVCVEVWDNNVEIQWRKPCTQDGTVEALNCFIGKDPSTLQPYQLPPFEEKMTELESFSEPEFSSLTSVSEDLRDELTKEESDSSGTSKENHDRSDVTMVSQKRKIFKERTLSESSVESINSKQATKGILKRRARACIGRSLSESSGGEEYSWIGSGQHPSISSSVTSSPSLSEINRMPLGESLKEEEEEYDEDEEDDDDDGEKVKKIVRFSDVISQKTYRSNSSILGQRKKNQRKMKNKKRAAERRASESENSVDEVEPSSDKQNSDAISGMSPPQKNEFPLPQDQSIPMDLITNQCKGKPKGLTKKKGSGTKGKGKKVNEVPKSDDSSGNPNSPTYEFKSDLIFQLEL